MLSLQQGDDVFFFMRARSTDSKTPTLRRLAISSSSVLSSCSYKLYYRAALGWEHRRAPLAPPPLLLVGDRAKERRTFPPPRTLTPALPLDKHCAIAGRLAEAPGGQPDGSLSKLFPIASSARIATVLQYPRITRRRCLSQDSSASVRAV